MKPSSPIDHPGPEGVEFVSPGQRPGLKTTHAASPEGARDHAWQPDEVWIERGELDSAIARSVVARLGGQPVHVVDDVRVADGRDMAAGKRRLLLQRHRGSFLQSCPAGGAGAVCCNYLVVNLASNCPFDCSYCFLQEYVANNTAVKVFTNVDDALAEIDVVLSAHPERRFRIGTGELADSLALDPLTDLSPRLVEFFAKRSNALLELKTKSDAVEALLGCDPNGRVVVSWSMNAASIVAADERGTASLAQRVAAARRVQDAGYRLGFHFDPLVEFDGWEDEYRATVDAIAAAVDVGRIAWVSLGSLRLTPRLEGVIRARGAAGRVLASEIVPGSDGKSRVWRGLRLRMYRTLAAHWRAVAPVMPIYLCMEPPAVWERVMGEVPSDRALGMRLAARTAW